MLVYNEIPLNGEWQIQPLDHFNIFEEEMRNDLYVPNERLTSIVNKKVFIHNQRNFNHDPRFYLNDVSTREIFLLNYEDTLFAEFSISRIYYIRSRKDDILTSIYEKNSHFSISQAITSVDNANMIFDVLMKLPPSSVNTTLNLFGKFWFQHDYTLSHYFDRNIIIDRNSSNLISKLENCKVSSSLYNDDSDGYCSLDREFMNYIGERNIHDISQWSIDDMMEMKLMFYGREHDYPGG